jgi:hypothetical protein
MVFALEGLSTMTSWSPAVNRGPSSDCEVLPLGVDFFAMEGRHHAALRKKVKRKPIGRVMRCPSTKCQEIGFLPQKSTVLPSENMRTKFFCLSLVQNFVRPNRGRDLAKASEPCSLLPCESTRLLLGVLDRILQSPLPS